MSLPIGQALGHYRILRQLGAGGMGEVYEAEYVKLGRRVALKVLPEETARDPQRRERFERGAKAFGLNPRNLDLALEVSGRHQTVRRYPEALRFVDIAISMAPDAPLLYLTKVFLKGEADGNTRAARETMKKIDRSGSSPGSRS